MERKTVVSFGDYFQREFEGARIRGIMADKAATGEYQVTMLLSPATGEPPNRERLARFERLEFNGFRFYITGVSPKTELTSVRVPPPVEPGTPVIVFEVRPHSYGDNFWKPREVTFVTKHGNFNVLCIEN